MTYYLKDQFAALARRSKNLMDFEVADAYARIMQDEQKNYSRIVENEPEFAHLRAFNLAQLGFEQNAANPKQLVLPLRPLLKNEYSGPIAMSLAKAGAFAFGALASGTMLYLQYGASAQALTAHLGTSVLLGLASATAVGFAGKYLTQAYNNAMKNTLALCVPKEWTKTMNDHDSTQLLLKSALRYTQVERIRYTPMH